MSLQVKTLSITELRKQDENTPLWVLNGTMKNPKDRSNVIIMLPLKNGEAQAPLSIFATWIPICVTDKIERKDVLSSRQFLTALDRRIILAISEEAAHTILSQQGAAEEAERVRMLDINSATGDALGSMEEDSSVKIEVPGLEDTQEDTIGNTVHQFIALLESNSGVEALNSLRNLGELNAEEYQLILKESRGLGDAYKEVSAFCRTKLGQLKGQQPTAVGGQVTKR